MDGPEIATKWSQKAKDLVSSVPLHLLGEQDFRRAFADLLLDFDAFRYRHPENLQFESKVLEIW